MENIEYFIKFVFNFHCHSCSNLLEIDKALLMYGFGEFISNSIITFPGPQSLGLLSIHNISKIYDH